jgi:hypothetical protein
MNIVTESKYTSRHVHARRAVAHIAPGAGQERLRRIHQRRHGHQQGRPAHQAGHVVIHAALARHVRRHGVHHHLHHRQAGDEQLPEQRLARALKLLTVPHRIVGIGRVPDGPHGGKDVAGLARIGAPAHMQALGHGVDLGAQHARHARKTQLDEANARSATNIGHRINRRGDMRIRCGRGIAGSRHGLLVVQQQFRRHQLALLDRGCKAAA